MSDTSVRVSEDTRKRLELARREGESLDDAIRRLAGSDRWLGFGALADEAGDTRDGLGRVRDEARRGVEDGDDDRDERGVE